MRMPINQLPTLRRISPHDLLAIFSIHNSDARKVSVERLFDFFIQEASSTSSFKTTTIIPGDSFEFFVENTDRNSWVQLTPIETIQTGKIILPNAFRTRDGLEVLITTTNQITDLTIDGSGAASMIGMPHSIRAHGHLRLKFSKPNGTWHRVA